MIVATKNGNGQGNRNNGNRGKSNSNRDRNFQGKQRNDQGRRNKRNDICPQQSGGIHMLTLKRDAAALKTSKNAEYSSK